jgi:predicted Zn-dependent peptidase
MADFQSMPVGRSWLVHCPLEHVESVSVGLWFKTGSRYEGPGQHGAAHFIEHLLFKGTKRRSARAITEAVESRGGDLNAFTSEEMTCFYARIEARRLDLVLDVLFDMLWKSAFLPKELERERGVILEEIRMYEDQPNVVAMEGCNAALWPQNALGRTILGTPESVRGFRRNDLQEFWRRHYRPSSLVVSVAGQAALPEVLKLLKPYVDTPRNTQRGLPWSPVRLPRTRRVTVVAANRPVQQCHFCLGVRGLARHDPRRYAEKLLSVILGENMSSRLFQTIREEHGLAYSIHTCVTHHFDTGAFYVNAGIDPENLEKTVALVAEELEKLRARAPGVAELRRAKDYTVGQMRLGMESTSSRMMWMGECMIGLNMIIQPQEVIQKLESVTAEEIKEIAGELFQPGRMVFSVCGPGVEEKSVAGAAEYLDAI